MKCRHGLARGHVILWARIIQVCPAIPATFFQRHDVEFKHWAVFGLDDGSNALIAMLGFSLGVGVLAYRRGDFLQDFTNWAALFCCARSLALRLAHSTQR